jgi:hypothetical protein
MKTFSLIEAVVYTFITIAFVVMIEETWRQWRRSWRCLHCGNKLREDPYGERYCRHCWWGPQR